MKKSKLLLYVTTLLSFVGVCIIYPSLPESIPINFDYQWQVGEYAPKYAALLMGLSPFLMALLLEVTVKIDPKWKKRSMNEGQIYVFQWLLAGLMIALSWFTIAVAKDVSLNVQFYMPMVMGVVFLLVGNFMPKIKSNYFLGIRTPWTLQSEVVWRKTHRVGGYIFVVWGFLFFLEALIQTEFMTVCLIAFIVIATLFLTLYSYLEYQKIESKKAE